MDKTPVVHPEAEKLRQYITDRVSKWFGEPVIAVEDEILALVSEACQAAERALLQDVVKAAIKNKTSVSIEIANKLPALQSTTEQKEEL